MGVSLGNVGFDASAAIASADALKKAFEGVNDTLERFSKIAKSVGSVKFGGNFDGLAKTLQQLISLQNGLGDAAQRSADAQAIASER